MPRASRLQLASLRASDESPGERLARIRRERGLADKTGLIQTLISDYEPGKLRLNADMIPRFGTGLGVSMDERKVLRRLELIEGLPERQQLTLLRTNDTFVENAELTWALRSG